MQMFAVAMFAIATTGIAIFGGRAVSAGRFHRVLRAYADPIPVLVEHSSTNEEARVWEGNRSRHRRDPGREPRTQVPEQRVS
ncbi:MAG: hypothetical protein QOG65_225 [Actinomycetota bacterium]|jgi:hypothetical protein|nr:hypothetical protein [Actinomycetota bacterium]